MKKSFFSGAFLALSLAATSAYADVSATGIAGASATINGGDSLFLGAAAAQCANSLGPVSWSDNTCERIMLANYWASRRNFVLADEIVVADPKVQRAIRSINEREASRTTTSTMNAPRSAPQPVRVTSSPTGQFTPVKVTTDAGVGRWIRSAATYGSYQSCVPIRFPVSGEIALKDGC